jgi:hypothetical protein
MNPPRATTMTLKKRAEYWATQAALTDIKPVWWRRMYIYVVFWFSPPRLDRED